MRDSKEELVVRLLSFVLGRMIQKKTWLHDCCFVLGRAYQNNARFKRRLDYETVVVCFGTQNSEEEWTIRLVLYRLGISNSCTRVFSGLAMSEW